MYLSNEGELKNGQENQIFLALPKMIGTDTKEAVIMNNKTRYAYVTYSTTVLKCAEIPYEEGDTEEDIIDKFKDGNITSEEYIEDNGCEGILETELPEKDEAGGS